MARGSEERSTESEDVIGKLVKVGFERGYSINSRGLYQPKYDWEEAVILERNELWTKLRTCHGHVTVVSRYEYESRLRYS